MTKNATAEGSRARAHDLRETLHATKELLRKSACDIDLSPEETDAIDAGAKALTAEAQRARSADEGRKIERMADALRRLLVRAEVAKTRLEKQM